MDKAGLSVICLRIGFFQDRPLEERHLAVWISPGDMARLVRCAIEAPGVRFEIVYGASNNTRRWWDLTRAREVLGYQPQDDSEHYAKDLLKDPPSAWLERVRWHGGTKCDLPFVPLWVSASRRVFWGSRIGPPCPLPYALESTQWKTVCSIFPIGRNCMTQCKCLYLK